MASLKTKFAVGLFVLMGAVIVAAAFIWLGMSRYLEEGKYYVAYFDESVQGLNNDSAVKYRGVSIGRVESIGVAPDENLIEVVLRIESGMTLTNNMAAKLKSVGITGIVFIEIDRKKEDALDRGPQIRFPAKHPIVATEPSEMKLFVAGINDLMDQFKQMNVGGLAEKMRTILDRINTTIEDAQIKNISTDIRLSLQKIEAILDTRKWDKVLASVNSATTSFKAFSDKSDQAVSDFEKVAVNLNGLLSENRLKIGQLVNSLNQTIRDADTFFAEGKDFLEDGEHKISNLEPLLALTLSNLESASASLTGLVELLSEQPSKLIFSTPPPAKLIEPDVARTP